MKTINVTVIIQMDIEGNNPLDEVRDGLDLINLDLQRNNTNNAQIFTQIDTSDLLEVLTDDEEED